MHVSMVFRKTIRTSDLIGRYGGEEFAIILRRCPAENGMVLAEKLRSILASTPVKVRGGAEIAVHVSIGVAAYRGDAVQSATDLTADADRALYAVKAAGRNRVEMA